jgi:ferredoxin
VNEQTAPLYIKIDLSKCCGYTSCAEAAPDLYKLDEQGCAYVDSETVPFGLAAKAQEGAASCPEGAIYVGEMRPD